MRRFLLASVGAAAFSTTLGVAVLAAASSASAADLGRPMLTKAPAYLPPLYYSWTGLYLGINGGYGWGSSRWSGLPTDTFAPSGGLIGGTVGYNWQFSQWVLGLEGDLDWTDIRGSTTFNCPAGCETSNHWLSTVRGRLGYGVDRWLPYVTGGAAFGDVKAATPNFAGVDTSRAGWAVGAGVEYAFAGPWSAKLEYLYVDLGSANCGLSCGAPSLDNVNLKANIFRGGVNFKF